MSDARHLNAFVDDDAPTLLRRSEPGGPPEEVQEFAPTTQASAVSTTDHVNRDLDGVLAIAAAAPIQDPWAAPAPLPVHTVLGDPWSSVQGEIVPATTRSATEGGANGIQVGHVIDIGSSGDLVDSDGPTRQMSPAEIRRAAFPGHEEVVYASAPLLAPQSDPAPISNRAPPGLYDDDAPTLIRKAPISDNAPTRLRKAPVSRRTGPISTKEADKVHIHPKFDPRCLPTMRTLRPAKPPPKRRPGIPVDGTIPMARPSSPAALGARGGVDLAWVVAFLAAGGVTVVIAAVIALVR